MELMTRMLISLIMILFSETPCFTLTLETWEEEEEEEVNVLDFLFSSVTYIFI